MPLCHLWQHAGSSTLLPAVHHGLPQERAASICLAIRDSFRGAAWHGKARAGEVCVSRGVDRVLGERGVYARLAR